MAARHHLSRRDARPIAVRAQPLTQPQPTDVLDVLRHLTLLHLPVPRRVGGVARAGAAVAVAGAARGMAARQRRLPGRDPRPAGRRRPDAECRAAQHLRRAPALIRVETTTAAAPGCWTRWSRGGEVARVRREGRLPLWDLAERVYAVRAAVRLHHRVGPRSRPSRRHPRGRPLERRPPATGQSRGEVACGVDGSAHVSELIR